MTERPASRSLALCSTPAAFRSRRSPAGIAGTYSRFQMRTMRSCPGREVLVLAVPALIGVGAQARGQPEAQFCSELAQGVDSGDYTPEELEAVAGVDC
jgi:hypothetical protein